VAVDLYESVWKITVGATVVLDFGDYMEGMLQCEPQKEVDATPFVGGGAKTFARPNIFHQFSWTKWHVCDSVHEAAALQLMHTKALKDLAGLDVTIQIANNTGSVTLNKATVSAFPSAIYERFVRFSYSLLGGALSGELALLNSLLLEDGTPLELEDGALLGLEGDGI
jgi:hypothetical protein